MNSSDFLGERIKNQAEAMYRQPIWWDGKTINAYETILDLDAEKDDGSIITLSSNIITITNAFRGLISFYDNTHSFANAAHSKSTYLYNKTDDEVIDNNAGISAATSGTGTSAAKNLSYYVDFDATKDLFLAKVSNVGSTYALDYTTQAHAAGTAITAITQANPGVVTAASHGRSNGDIVYISGGDMTEINNKRLIVANATTNTFELTDDAGNVDTSGFTAYTTGGAVARTPDLKVWGVKLVEFY